METIRQGDVLLERVGDEGDKPGAWEKPEKAALVLAHGELTGHVHAFGPDMGISVLKYSMGRPERVRIPKGGAMLLHGTPEKDYADGDHAPVQVPEGAWRVRIQREYEGMVNLD